MLAGVIILCAILALYKVGNFKYFSGFLHEHDLIRAGGHWRASGSGV